MPSCSSKKVSFSSNYKDCCRAPVLRYWSCHISSICIKHDNVSWIWKIIASKYRLGKMYVNAELCINFKWYKYKTLVSFDLANYLGLLPWCHEVQYICGILPKSNHPWTMSESLFTFEISWEIYQSFERCGVTC